MRYQPMLEANVTQIPDNQVVNQRKSETSMCRGALLAALEQHHWQVTKTANFFNMSRQTIYRKMRDYKITKPL